MARVVLVLVLSGLVASATHAAPVAGEGTPAPTAASPAPTPVSESEPDRPAAPAGASGAGMERPAAEVVAERRAAEVVGREATIEGRVFATHSSPLATVLAFSPNFAGFTATILATDRAKFPSDLEQRYRDRVVRVTGLVTAYRGKPEMRLREPSQLVEVEGQAATSPPADRGGPAAGVGPAADQVETRRILTLIEERLGALEHRLAVLEQSLEPRLAALERSAASPAGAAPGGRFPPVLTVGAPVADVRAFLGEPVRVSRRFGGEVSWLYGEGRSVTFDRTGRLVGWTGF